ncbi:unnamed protein product [Peniophora sp. CBMAI 1063]|nr:unnamed protein product [Peniophora sp. CBMAI 1063]
MSSVLGKLRAMMSSVIPIPGAYNNVMTQTASPYLARFFEYLNQCAGKEIAIGILLQKFNGFARDHILVSRHYRLGAGYLQLRFLAMQGLNSFYAALTENYAILEGNRFVPGTFYTDFNIPE